MPLSVLEASHPTDSPTVICPCGPALTEYRVQVSLFRDAVLGFNCSRSDDCHREGMRTQQKQKNAVQLCCKLHFSSLCTVAACQLPGRGSASWDCKHLGKDSEIAS